MTNSTAKRARAVKPVKAWAIFDGDELAVWDYRVQIMWHKMTAKAELSRLKTDHGFTVREVEIRLLKGMK